MSQNHVDIFHLTLTFLIIFYFFLKTFLFCLFDALSSLLIVPFHCFSFGFICKQSLGVFSSIDGVEKDLEGTVPALYPDALGIC